MQKSLLLLLPFLFLACNTVKKTQTAINEGNYQMAVQTAVEKLREDKTRKSNQAYILLLEEAYAKAVNQDMERINFLEKDGNPEYLKEIYETYALLDQRQRAVKALMPLRLEAQEREAKFQFKNYTDALLDAKDRLSLQVYQQAELQLQSEIGNKADYRALYQDLEYIQRINPGYRDIRLLMDQVREKGTNYVQLALYNDTQMVIPKNLEYELLDLNTYGLDNFWTTYHTQTQQGKKYDYQIELLFRDIQVSPEQLRETLITREKEIVDGWKYLTDRDGKQVKDSLGKPIKVDRLKKVICEFQSVQQLKTASLAAEVLIVNLTQPERKQRFPLQTNFAFQHAYGLYDGDKRALLKEDLTLIDQGVIPFPSTEQMIFDAGQDLKQQLKGILKRGLIL